MVNTTTNKAEDNPTLESLAMTGPIDMNDNDIINLNVARFNLAPSVTPAEGDLYWNATDKTLNIKTDTETVIQIGQEMVLRSKNNTGVQINNGEVVYISGADTARPEITLANANSWETSQTTIGIATQDIANGSEGFITVFGLVRDVDTSGMSEGAIVYLGTTDGEFTTTRPTHPDFVVRVGYVINVDPSTGIIFFSVDHDRNESFFNGTFNESFDALVTSNGTIITMSLEHSGGGNLTLRFSDGPSTLDTTPAATIVLTAGTDEVPVFNYIYIPQSTKVLTKSTSGFPTATEHIKVGSFFVQSATRVQSHGALVNQNHNDHGAGTDLMGHMAHTAERIRHEGAIFTSGLAGAGIDDYLTLALGSSFFKSNSGTIYQMHRHIVPAFDQSASDEILIVNHHDGISPTPYLASSDLFTDITHDSGGSSIGLNKYFNLTFIAIGNKTGEYSPILCNLPSGSYNTQAGAEQDTSGHDNFNIPEAFNIDSSTGLLICRLTIQMGSTWTYISTSDLRGRTPQTATAGGPGVALTSFDDAAFDIHNATDPTKRFFLDASNITTGTDRTATIPDKDFTIAGIDDIQGLATQHSDISDAGSGVIISAAERTALHAIFTPGLVTAHSDVSDAGSGVIISAAERTALHAVYTIAADLAANKTISGNWRIDNALGFKFLAQGGGSDQFIFLVNDVFSLHNASLLVLGASAKITARTLQLSNALAVAYGGTGATNAGDALNNLGISDAGSGIIISAAERTALHNEVTRASLGIATSDTVTFNGVISTNAIRLPSDGSASVDYISVGIGDDLRIFHDAINTWMVNATGTLIFLNNANGTVAVKSGTGFDGWFQVNTTDANDANSDAKISLLEQNVFKWTIMNDGSDSDRFRIFHDVAGVDAMTIANDGSIVFGAPTGGDKGIGTVNAKAVYDDGTLLTCWPIQLWKNKAMLQEDIDLHGEGKRLYSIDEIKEFMLTNEQMPAFPSRTDWEQSREVITKTIPHEIYDIDGELIDTKEKISETTKFPEIAKKFSTGKLQNAMWETIEQLQIYIFELHDRIKLLEAN